jgi:hypothetical protein
VVVETDRALIAALALGPIEALELGVVARADSNRVRAVSERRGVERIGVPVGAVGRTGLEDSGKFGVLRRGAEIALPAAIDGVVGSAVDRELLRRMPEPKSKESQLTFWTPLTQRPCMKAEPVSVKLTWAGETSARVRMIVLASTAL